MAYPTKSAGTANTTRRLVKMLWSRVSLSFDILTWSSADTMVVESVPMAHRGVLTMAPVKPPTHPRKAALKGKVIPCPTTWLHAHKVTQIATPTPEVTAIEAPPPPVSGLNRVRCAPLFEEAVGSGDEQVGKVAPTSSGKCHLGPQLQFTD